MKTLTNIAARVLFSVPFIMFGSMHLFKAQMMAGMVPAFIPGGIFWVYLTGIAMIAAAISFITLKYHYMAGLLLALLLLILVFTVQMPSMLKGEMMGMIGMIKDTGLAGGALLMAGFKKN